MNYYNIEGKKIEFEKDDNKYINSGCCASVYRYDLENAIKIYNDICPQQFRLNEIMFNEIKSIESDNLVKISDILYEENIKKDFNKISYKEATSFNQYEVVAYIMKYYEQSKLNILETDIDYMLQNMYQLEKLFDTFAKKNIQVDDVKYLNVILEENNMVLIDPDLFKKCDYSYNGLKKFNNYQLSKLFKSLFENHYDILQEQIPEFIGINNELFSIKLSESDNITKILSKRLHHVKYPINYFYRKSSKKL